MHPIDRVTSRIPVLLNDFFKHQHKKNELTVFLCGRRPDDPHFDLRKQVEHLLETRMGCDAFLGEDIKDLKFYPRLNLNHLSIEVKEARESDLVILFLESAGTISEVTAFAMDEAVNKKLIVFNDVDHRDDESFINYGPLRLLTKEQVIHYDARDEAPSEELVKHLDTVVARHRFDHANVGSTLPSPLSFEEWIVLCLIFVSYPIRYKELTALFPWDEPRKEPILRSALRTLFASSYVEELEGKYVPRLTLQNVPMSSGFIGSLARTRMALLGHRLRDDEAVADYRLLL